MAPSEARLSRWSALLAGSILIVGMTAGAVTQARNRMPPVESTRVVSPDPLLEGFRNPPASARPRLWWHWLDGNISKEGIRKDLEWMQRIGIGGVQNFDGSAGLPPSVDKRIVYMSPEWQDAFRFAAQLADKLDLEFGTASAAGWSETGGPWVKPENAVKKFVWSETDTSGGRRFTGTLPAPPATVGAFQTLPPTDAGMGHPLVQPYYVDSAVFAFPIQVSPPMPSPTITLGNSVTMNSAVLSDGDWSTGEDIPRPTADADTVVNLRYDRPVTVRSAHLFISGAANMYAGPSINVSLEGSLDGRSWGKVANISPSIVPTTASFAPVSARYFRVVMTPGPARRDNLSSTAPGFGGFPAPTPSRKMRLLDLRLSSDARVDHFESKAGFSVAANYAAFDEAGQDRQTHGVSPRAVIDLTDRMHPDGTLDWTPPKGNWRIIRLGYSLTGAVNHPATSEATGLEADKLDGVAVRDYLETYINHLHEAVSPALIGSHGLRALVTDSTEVGPFNWTPRMLEQFQRLRGYDPRPWLPALTGNLVGTRAQSDEFLFDFRRTIAELHASEHYGTVAAVAREHGLKWYCEANEGGRTSLGDDMDMRRYADVPMAALWVYPRELGPRASYVFDMLGAASTAHVYGQQQVAAESMTSSRWPWAQAPSDLRRVVDAEFANGINLPVIHTSVHQPTEAKPGLSMRHIGQFFTRNETWAEMAKPWIDYLARNSYMLQQGRFVADVAYFYGEDEPTVELADIPYFDDVPRRYGYDLLNARAVLDALKVDNGDLVTTGGARYRILFLSGTSDRMTLPMLRRLLELVEAGATVVGNAPSGAPALGDDPTAYRALVSRLWPGTPTTLIGKGRVIAGKDVESALAVIGVPPDIAFRKTRPGTKIGFVHRQLADGEIYFLSNAEARAETVEARFRVTGKAPEIWRADTGERAPISYDIDGKDTVVQLAFEPEDSFFVVFRKPATAASLTFPETPPLEVARLSGPWLVNFEHDRGAPASATLPDLAPLNENADPGVKYFSGIATYAKTFAAPRGFRVGSPLLLDLGRVGDLAEVRVNSNPVGTVWHAPFRLDIGPAVRSGMNQLEVRVANLWVNRLIGDAQPGAQKITFTVGPTYRADAPLRPSGLMGPVRIMLPSPVEQRP